MKKHILTAEPRNVFGRKTKLLRKNGQTPATIYGKGMTSESLTIETVAFTKVYKETGESGLIELTVGKTIHPVLVNVVQINPVSRDYLHIEFHKVDLKEKVQANIPVIFIGTAPAVEEKIGVLLTLLDEIEVEALPTELPESIEINVSTLTNINDVIDASSVVLPHGVTLVTPADSAIVRVAELISHAAEEAAASDAAAQAEAKVESADAAPAEGAKTEEGKPEEKKTEVAPEK
jgi:large subunit ribosomal protein L25